MISFSKNLSYFLLTECKTVLRTYIHHFVLKDQDSFGVVHRAQPLSCLSSRQRPALVSNMPLALPALPRSRSIQSMTYTPTKVFSIFLCFF